ncbi:MAG: DUF2849 domain-containing protein [Fimbriimonadaceae bacterium]|nr:DUF2849 domain-containing protein [Alphaproteobacteria bacterium]
MSLKILTANHLSGGHVVFLGDDRNWTGDIDAALLAGSPGEIAALQDAGQSGENDNIVVGAYLIDVARDETGKIVPVRLRERLRLNGPSIRPDLGYQGGNWHPGFYQSLYQSI